jgi:hypothetical protein
VDELYSINEYEQTNYSIIGKKLFCRRIIFQLSLIGKNGRMNLQKKRVEQNISRLQVIKFNIK